MAEQYPKALVCRVLGVAPSSHYYQPQTSDERALKNAISEVCGRYPRYGYRRVTAELHRRRWLVNRKRVARLMAEMGLQAKKVVRKRRHSARSESRIVSDGGRGGRGQCLPGAAK
jgi:putative transposase